MASLSIDRWWLKEEQPKEEPVVPTKTFKDVPIKTGQFFTVDDGERQYRAVCYVEETDTVLADVSDTDEKYISHFPMSKVKVLDGKAAA